MVTAKFLEDILSNLKMRYPDNRAKISYVFSFRLPFSLLARESEPGWCHGTICLEDGGAQVFEWACLAELEHGPCAKHPHGKYKGVLPAVRSYLRLSRALIQYCPVL